MFNFNPNELEEGQVVTIHMEVTVSRSQVIPEGTIRVEYGDQSVDVLRPEEGGTFSDMVDDNEALAELLEGVDLSHATITVNDDEDNTIDADDEVPEDAIALSVTEDNEEDDSDDVAEEDSESSDETA